MQINITKSVPAVVLSTCVTLACVMPRPCEAQDSAEAGSTRVSSSIGNDGRGSIVVEARGQLPEPRVFYTASSEAVATVGAEEIEQVVRMSVRVIQGDAKTLSFGLRGDGEVVDVQAEAKDLASWSVRQDGEERYVDLHLTKNVTKLKCEIKMISKIARLPVQVELLHMAPAEAVGFASIIDLHYAAEVKGRTVAMQGFVPIDAANDVARFQTTTGGKIKLSLTPDDAAPGPVELEDTTLHGVVNANGKSIRFQLRSTARVTTDDADLTILSGHAAFDSVPAQDGFRLRLSTENDQPVYKLHFPQAGTFPVTLDFVAPLVTANSQWRGVDFTVAAAAVVPLTLSGLDPELDFQRDQQSVVPLRENDKWLGFLPATGRAKLQWKTSRAKSEGKLFFATTGQVEAQVGAGLLRQDHQIDFQVLQGELNSLRFQLLGPGEVLDVQGSDIIAWKVTGEGTERQLDATLSQPITSASRISIRSQTPLDAFPATVEGLRLQPVGAIRHSGYLRLTNSGSVRLEPTALSGLTQLGPKQFPGEAREARQTFVYRFPAADHAFTVVADRIQSEVSISQVLLYQASDNNRIIQADIELDIREAPVREWDFSIPDDYSVVSVTGANLVDYVTATQSADSRRNLKVIFGQDVLGRQLVTLRLEKNATAAAGVWDLPRILYPEAKTVRGSVGVIGAAGFRIAVDTLDKLVEIPVSYFPKGTPGLQQAFRIREPEWSATMQVVQLEQSVHADVFHLYSLSQETVHGSALINYFVTGAPATEWRIQIPSSVGNVMVDGQDVRTWRREQDTLIVSLHQPVMGAYTLLVTFEEKPAAGQGTFSAGQVTPLDVQGERGYIQVVSPIQVEIETLSVASNMLTLEPMELPAEFRLLSTAPPLGTWQYTERPADRNLLNLKVTWFQPGETLTQVVEFSEANSRVSQDGELITDILYYVKSRGQRTLKLTLPGEPVRLWEAYVDGQPVTARQTDSATLIPLPGNADPNTPVEVRLRLGKPSVRASRPKLALPIISAPVLKTQWNVASDDRRVLVPSGGTVTPAMPVLRPTSFSWVAQRGLIHLVLISLFAGIGGVLRRTTGLPRVLALISLACAIATCISAAKLAYDESASPAPLQLTLPMLPADERVELHVNNTPLWRSNVSWLGLALGAIGIASIMTSWFGTGTADNDDGGRVGSMVFGKYRNIARVVGGLLIALGLLLQRDAAAWFYGLLGALIFLIWFLPSAWDWFRRLPNWTQGFAERRHAKDAASQDPPGESGTDPSGGAVTALVILVALTLGFCAESCQADAPNEFRAADSIVQEWNVSHQDARLVASGKISLSGQPGDRFVLLRSPAVLTRFAGEGLRLTKSEIAGAGLAYVISIPTTTTGATVVDDARLGDSTSNYEATFEFQLEAIRPLEGMPVLTGGAAVQAIDLRYDEAGWDVISPTAVRIEKQETDPAATRAQLLLGPGRSTIRLSPKVRDASTEDTRFFVEASHLYLPRPGVVDGRHQLQIRPSQGQVSQLVVQVPAELTVSHVNVPIGSWKFDAESGRLQIEIEPSQSQTFAIRIDTQRSLAPLPTDINLAPLRVVDADGEVGLVALAFGPEAQPEKAESETMSTVNIGDFDANLMGDSKSVVHRVYRYGAEGGELTLRVAPVEPEVRVTSKQVLSLGDERVVLGINFAVEITRAGLFQLSFPLPLGLEVESLTGDSLHHWAELNDDNTRHIILHLNGKTIGTQTFALALAGPAPTGPDPWIVPRFELQEASRQTGELVVRPTTGIRLRTVSPRNVSETDPRELGGKAQGALAFRLLQRDWEVALEIETLEAWITGQVLHEVTLREGQTRSAIAANFDVRNASISNLKVALPITNEDEVKTLRATGDIVSDFVRTLADPSVWELQFKRRVIGKIQFRIEYERRGERANDTESVRVAGFSDARQLSYYVGIRPGGRLEVEHGELPPGWQRIDWNAIPVSLRDIQSQTRPAITLRAATPEKALEIQAKRHSVADALKLRVAQGALTTVLSQTGDQLTAVDLTMDVIQRSSLSVGLPHNGELFSIFVNGESVNSVRLGNATNTWQFYILPGIDDRTASVRFVYSVPGNRIRKLRLRSPQLNVPLENIVWNVIPPKGLTMTGHDGNMEWVGQQNQQTYDRDSYLSKMSGKRQVQAQRASELLDQANQLLQAGEQTKARWALNSVANQYALDAASNEDARVQLENLQTQQAIVGLNSRRQRLYLDNDDTDGTAIVGNQQLREAAASNRILSQDEMNFRPQEMSQLLRGNSTEDNVVLQQIAGRLVQHQRTAEPAPQAIVVSLPEEGEIFTFERSVQVAENSPLELDLQFGSPRQLSVVQYALVMGLVIAFATSFGLAAGRK